MEAVLAFFFTLSQIESFIFLFLKLLLTKQKESWPNFLDLTTMFSIKKSFLGFCHFWKCLNILFNLPHREISTQGESDCMAIVLSWLIILNRTYKLTSLDYNNSARYLYTTQYTNSEQIGAFCRKHQSCWKWVCSSAVFNAALTLCLPSFILRKFWDLYKY